jgi:hypothetical protein
VDRRELLARRAGRPPRRDGRRIVPVPRRRRARPQRVRARRRRRRPGPPRQGPSDDVGERLLRPRRGRRRARAPRRDPRRGGAVLEAHPLADGAEAARPRGPRPRRIGVVERPLVAPASAHPPVGGGERPDGNDQRADLRDLRRRSGRPCVAVWSARLPGLRAPDALRGPLRGTDRRLRRHGVLGERTADAGPGVVVADVAPGAVPPRSATPDRFWLHRRGPLPAFAWSWQRQLGRRQYARTRSERNA